MKKTILYLLISVLAGAGVAYYMYNKPVEGAGSMNTDFKIQSSELFAEFEKDETASNTKFLDKVIEVSGTVQSVKTEEGKTSVVLDGGMMFGIICELDPNADHKRTEFKEGESATFKGICTGMLMDVVLVRCVEI